MDQLRICTGLGNYYGSVEFFKNGDKCFMELDNWDGLREITVSEEFFNAALKEFGE